VQTIVSATEHVDPLSDNVIAVIRNAVRLRTISLFLFFTPATNDYDEQNCAAYEKNNRSSDNGSNSPGR